MKTSAAIRDLHFLDPDTWALYLDVDGTLVEIASTPDLVMATPDLIATLEILREKFKGAIAIVTGRQLVEADRILAPLRLAGAGVHGGQIRYHAGGAINSVAPAISPRLVRDVSMLATAASGILVENKGIGIAVHYRNVPDRHFEIETQLRRMVHDSGEAVTLCQGRMVLEILPAKSSKQSALTLLSRLPAFEGRKPLYIGDDRPDETAIAAAVALGGLGLKVAGEYFTGATADFAGPAQVRHWLGQIAHCV